MSSAGSIVTFGELTIRDQGDHPAFFVEETAMNLHFPYCKWGRKSSERSNRTVEYCILISKFRSRV